MATSLKLGSVLVDVVKKDIKNVHLGVYPPKGRVRISAPLRMSNESVRLFAVSKLPWIRQQQHKLDKQERETPKEYLERESHYLWGKRHLLHLVERDGAAKVELQSKKIVLYARASLTTVQKERILDEWYRNQVRIAVEPVLSKWETLMGVKVQRVFVRRMRTKWGSCSRTSHGIRLNTELAKKPSACLEYIVVHELAHLIEPTHNARFVSLLDQLLPNWRSSKKLLNELPIRHEDWQ